MRSHLEFLKNYRERECVWYLPSKKLLAIMGWSDRASFASKETRGRNLGRGSVGRRWKAKSEVYHSLNVNVYYQQKKLNWGMKVTTLWRWTSGDLLTLSIYCLPRIASRTSCWNPLLDFSRSRISWSRMLTEFVSQSSWQTRPRSRRHSQHMSSPHPVSRNSKSSCRATPPFRESRAVAKRCTDGTERDDAREGRACDPTTRRSDHGYHR